MPMPTETEESRHPYELFLLTIYLAIGIVIVFGGDVPPSIIAADSDGYIATTWGYLLMFGAGLALFGTARHNGMGQVNSLLVTQIGLFALGASALLYAVAILIVVGVPGFLPASIAGWFGLQSLRRYWQIQRKFNCAIKASKGSDEH